MYLSFWSFYTSETSHWGSSLQCPYFSGKWEQGALRDKHVPNIKATLGDESLHLSIWNSTALFPLERELQKSPHYAPLVNDLNFKSMLCKTVHLLDSNLAAQFIPLRLLYLQMYPIVIKRENKLQSFYSCSLLLNRQPESWYLNFGFASKLYRRSIKLEVSCFLSTKPCAMGLCLGQAAVQHLCKLPGWRSRRKAHHICMWLNYNRLACYSTCDVPKIGTLWRVFEKESKYRFLLQKTPTQVMQSLFHLRRDEGEKEILLLKLILSLFRGCTVSIACMTWAGYLYSRNLYLDSF